MEPSLQILNNMKSPDNKKNQDFEEKDIKNENIPKKEKTEKMNEKINIKEKEKILENIKEKEKINNLKDIPKENNKKGKNIILEENKIKDNQNNNNNFQNLIKKLKEIELSGNGFYKKGLFDEAIDKYKLGYNIIQKELLEVNRNRISGYHHPDIQEFLSLSKHIMSNLSLSYLNKNKYEESIEMDKKIFSLDAKYDKSYARLFKSYLKLNKKAEAVFFGDILIHNFNDEVKAKYKDLIPLIEKEKKNLEIEYEIEKEKKRKEARKNCLKLLIPFISLIISYVYLRYFKK